jgi:hypothetical protein
LSIVLNDDIELQEEEDGANTPSDEPSETCEQEEDEVYDDRESSSSQSDEYLSDTSGY